MTKGFSSNFAKYMEGMAREKHNAGFSLKYMDKHLDEFDCFCRDHFPDKDSLDKELVEAWCIIRNQNPHRKYRNVFVQ